MILYVNGDSHSASAELNDTSNGWQVLLSQKLNTNLVNDACIGGSNPRILRTTKEFLSQSKDDIFIIIGWTGWEREEWLHNGTYYQVNASGIDHVPEELQSTYKEWVVKQNDGQRENKSKDLHAKIFQLHNDLKNKNIKHLFFNAVMPFQHLLLDPEHLDWCGNYLGPYDNDLSYYWHLKNRGFASTNYYHFLETAHKYWANFLYQYIQDKKLL